MDIRPTTLDGNHVRLEPLTIEHHAALCRAGLDPELWRWTTSVISGADEMRAYIEDALRLQARGNALPFVIRGPDGEIAGSTRYGNIDHENRRVEIGWTWVTPRWQRTPVNTEAKYLLMRHAFHALGCIRVEFKTDVLNAKSRAALAGIGAREEGVLRSHMITATGRLRDTVYFSVIRPEWPDVRTRLEEKLRRPFQVP